MNFNGIRRAGATYMTMCCGREAIRPAEAEMLSDDPPEVQHTELGTLMSDENFPDADLICPGCERTWPPDCDHNSVTLLEPSNPTISDGSRSFRGECDECGQTIGVYVEVQDAWVLDNE